MREIGCRLLLAICIFAAGCGNVFSEMEYNSDEKIAGQADRFAKQDSMFNPVDGGYELTMGEFNGRETLWALDAEESCDIQISFTLSLTAGKVKLVHIDAEGNVTTLLECTPETTIEEAVDMTIGLSSGENRLKIVGFGCENVHMVMLSDDISW